MIPSLRRMRSGSGDSSKIHPILPSQIFLPEPHILSQESKEELHDEKSAEPLADAAKFFKDKERSSVEHFSPNTGALLGIEEMEKCLGGKKAIIQITTWNMGSLPLPKEHQLKKLFFHTQDETLKKVDFHIVAIQECWPDSDAWENALQTVLGTSFVIFDSLAFGTLHLTVFIRRDLVWFTTEPQDFTVSVRSGRLFKTKGGAGISFGFFGSRFLFLSAHLSAGCEESRIRQRVEELRKILTNEKDKHLTHYDAIFLAGDLNFRISSMSREEVIEALRKNNLSPLLDKDELNNLFHRVDTIPKFMEHFHEAAGITFRPTYKYDLGSDVFDSSSKKRAPAYTDRILYKSKELQVDYPTVVCLAYEAVTNMRVSDHKPVYAIFSVDIKPGFDTLQITGGRFKREVFVRATQQKAKYLMEYRKKLASNVCCVS